MVKQKLAGFSRDAVLYGAGDALGRLVGLVMFPLLSRVFVPADYGAIDLLMVSAAFLSQLVALSLPSGLQRFYFRHEEGKDRQTLVTSCVTVGGVIGGTAGLGFFIAAPALARLVPDDPVGVADSIRWLAIALPSVVVTEQLILLLRLERRAIAFGLLNVFRVLAQPVLTAIAVVGFERGLDGVFLAQFVANVLTLGVAGYLVRDVFRGRMDLPLVLRVIRFSLPGLPHVLIVQMMQLLPRYILVTFSTLTAVGLFGVGLRIAGVQVVFMRAFARAWNPFAYENEGAEDEKRLYEIALRGAMVIVTGSSVLLSVFAADVLAVLAPPEYGAAAWLVPGIALHFAVDGLSPIFGTILYTRDGVRWTSYLAIARLAVFLGLSVLLVPIFQAQGLIASMLVGVFVQLVGNVIVTRRRLPVDISWVRALLMLLAGAVTVVGAQVLPGPLVVVLLAKTSLVGAWTLVAWNLLFDAGERIAIAEAVRSRLGRRAEAGS